jgi:IS30 family transposase
MSKTRTYRHLSAEERAAIMIEHHNGVGARSIARRLGRSPATISRELRRVDSPHYDAAAAGRQYRQRRERCRRRRLLTEDTRLY